MKVWYKIQNVLTLILLTWRIWRVPNNASRWQMGFNLVFKGLNRAVKQRQRHKKLADVTCKTISHQQEHL